VSLVFNQAALDFLLENPAGPVGQDLRRRAEAITQLVRDNATKVLEQLPPEVVQYEIVSGDDGLAAVIGVQGIGRWSTYLAAKEQREAVIFAPALAQGLDVN
jgi:predicted esterase YcpF (UPF0227 family)